MAVITKKSFNAPDEVRSPKETMRVEVVGVNGHELRRHTAAPGYAGQDCDIDHLLYVVSGKLYVRMPGGDEIEFGPGDVGAIPPGHDARNAGKEPVVWLEIPH